MRWRRLRLAAGDAGRDSRDPRAAGAGAEAAGGKAAGNRPFPIMGGMPMPDMPDDMDDMDMPQQLSADHHVPPAIASTEPDAAAISAEPGASAIHSRRKGVWGERRDGNESFRRNPS